MHLSISIIEYFDLHVCIKLLSYFSSFVKLQEFCGASALTQENRPRRFMEEVPVICAGRAKDSDDTTLKTSMITHFFNTFHWDTCFFLSIVYFLSQHDYTALASFWSVFSCYGQFSSVKLQENGISQPSVLVALCQYDGVWNSQVLKGLLSREKLEPEEGELIFFIVYYFIFLHHSVHR